MKLRTVITSLLLFSHLVFAQTSPERYATKSARIDLTWQTSPVISAVHQGCGIQFLPQGNLFNVVLYPSGLSWVDTNHQQAFLSEYIDEPNFRSAHFDGTLEIQGNPGLTQAGTYPVTANGNWTWKGNSTPGVMSGSVIVSENGSLNVSLQGNFQWSMLNIQPNDRSILDLPDATQVEIVASLSPL